MYGCNVRRRSPIYSHRMSVAQYIVCLTGLISNLFLPVCNRNRINRIRWRSTFRSRYRYLAFKRWVTAPYRALSWPRKHLSWFHGVARIYGHCSYSTHKDDDKDAQRSARTAERTWLNGIFSPFRTPWNNANDKHKSTLFECTGTQIGWIGAPGDGGPRWDVYFTRRTSYVMARSCPHLAHTTMHDKSFPTLFDFRKTWSHRSSLWKYDANGQCYRCENNRKESIEQIVNAYDRVLSRQENCLCSSHVGSATVYV